MKKKLFALVALVALLEACASTNTFKQGASDGVVATHTAYALIQDTEMQLACGKPGAPAAPACVPPDLHKQISAVLEKVAHTNGQAAAAVAALPPTITGPTPEILQFVKECWDLINDVIALFPQSPQAAAMTTTVKKLQVK
jgi:hypothetical protein